MEEVYDLHGSGWRRWMEEVYGLMDGVDGGVKGMEVYGLRDGRVRDRGGRKCMA